MRLYEVLDSGRALYNDMKNIPNGRERSWEHCHTAFMGARGATLDEDVIDTLCLHLSFYLASWGMYRGSSFLLQRDYKIHTGIIKILYNKKFDCLWELNINKELYKNIDIIGDLIADIRNYYEPIRSSVCSELGKTKPQMPVSYTLISKVILGTMACVPAFDRLFIDGIKTVCGFTGAFSMGNIKSLWKYYADNSELFEPWRKEISNNGIQYTPMKVLDMCFWKIGYELSTKQVK